MADPIATLEARLPGRVGRPGSAIAQKGARVFCPEARELEPAAVIAAANAEEVAAVLAWAGEIGERVSVRSGGHSFDGAPLLDGGVLLDLQGLDSVDVREGGAGRARARVRAEVDRLAARRAGAGGADWELPDCGHRWTMQWRWLRVSDAEPRG